MKAFIKKIIHRILTLEKQRVFHKKIARIYRSGRGKYSKVLDRQKIEAHKNRWSPLKKRTNPKWYRVLSAISGNDSIDYVPEDIYYLIIEPRLNDPAFLQAYKDKNFYEHGGLDFTGLARAAVVYAQNFGSNRRPQGASTITQQVAKNFLLTNEVSFTRKIKEALLAMRIERTYSKDRILELYLNEIYLGLGAYGIAAASLVYFDKSVNELTVAEASYLASLPKARTTAL